MADSFASDNDIVVVATDLTPDSWYGVVWKATQIAKLALGCDLRESSSIFLANGNEFTAILRSPSP